MAIVSIAKGRSLVSPAANSYKRMRSAGLPTGGINSSYRSLSGQIKIFFERYVVQWRGRGRYSDARWYKGKRYVRISSAGMVAVPGTSTHGEGLALDMSTSSAAHAWVLRHGAAYGWKRTIRSEPWHFEYSGKRDTNAVEPIQAAVHVTTDGIWAGGTDKGTWAVRAASRFRGIKFPYGKRYTQSRVHTSPDGVWGNLSRTAHDKAVMALQRALARLGLYNGKIDGIYGPVTEKGFKLARKIFKR